MPNNPPEPVRGPNGFIPDSNGGGGGAAAPDLIVGFYPGYDSTISAPLSKGMKFTTAVQPLDFGVAGFGFDDTASVDLVVIGPTPVLTPATLTNVVITNGSGTDPATIAGTFVLASIPVESVGQYALVVTNADGERGLVSVEILDTV